MAGKVFKTYINQDQVNMRLTQKNLFTILFLVITNFIKKHELLVNLVNYLITVFRLTGILIGFINSVIVFN